MCFRKMTFCTPIDKRDWQTLATSIIYIQVICVQLVESKTASPREILILKSKFQVQVSS
jgi:hypothetical protein